MADLAILVPKPTISNKSGGQLSVTAPLPTVGTADYECDCAIVAPVPTVAIETISISAGLNINVPVPELSINPNATSGILAIEVPAPDAEPVSTYTIGTAALEAPKPKVAMTWLSGTFGDLEIAVSVPTASITGFSSTGGSLDITVPTPVVVLTESFGSWKCLVMNTDTMALSEYANYDFVGFAKLGDTVLALHRNGSIYELGGDTDAGTDISAVFETGMDDSMLGTIKSLHGVVAGLKSDGETQYRPHFDRDYGDAFTFDSTDDYIGSRRADSNQMELSRTIGVEFSNVDGSDFIVDCLDLLVRVSERRTIDRYGR